MWTRIDVEGEAPESVVRGAVGVTGAIVHCFGGHAGELANVAYDGDRTMPTTERCATARLERRDDGTFRWLEAVRVGPEPREGHVMVETATPGVFLAHGGTCWDDEYQSDMGQPHGQLDRLGPAVYLAETGAWRHSWEQKWGGNWPPYYTDHAAVFHAPSGRTLLFSAPDRGDLPRGETKVIAIDARDRSREGIAWWSWATLEARGEAHPAERRSFTATIFGDRVHVLGGATRDDLMWVFDARDDRWSRPAIEGWSPEPLAAHSATTLRGRWLVVHGGSAREWLLYDMHACVWHAMGESGMPAAVMLATIHPGTAAETIVALGGGFGGEMPVWVLDAGTALERVTSRD